MDLTVVTYLLYLAITVPLTIWVARALHRHGEVFLIDVFKGDERVANAVNQLLVIGFYLLNFGFLSFFMASDVEVTTARQVLEQLSTKVGVVALVVGLVHFANVGWLNGLRRRAVHRNQAPTPPAPAGPVWHGAAPQPGWAPPGSGAQA
ncbi:MAG: hypothetical protein QOJ69_1916 [Actinomycetota bacterium]|nr:hypothetical protein [Actinomycetota bacterium]